MTEEEEGSFKIKDRRRFDESGNLKGSGVADLNPQESQSAGRPVEQQQSTSERSEFVMNDDAEGAESVGRVQDGGEDEGIDYSSFVLSLATQAMVQLGEMPSPPGVNIPKNREAARHTIDVIEMLEKKTVGN
ncbi:MAG: DUF1844 domain-containing protein, partial [Bdellovibrionales bacterium]|nr:DUF1844 domain-containing protein [Bdellovibrionales bacterium]